MLFGDVIPGKLGIFVDVLLLVHLLAVLYWIVATCRQSPQPAVLAPGDSVLKRQKPREHHQD